MGKVSTNAISIEYALEQSVGVLPETPSWHLIEPNDVTTLGASISTVARNPISKDRQGRKGAVTDVDSAVEIPVDTTLSSLDEFIPAFLFSEWSDITELASTAVTATGYTVASGGELPADTLISVIGSVHPENNGFKVVGIGSTPTEVAVSGLVAETSADIKVTVAGIRNAEGDIVIDADGKITSTTLDFTTLPMEVGSFIFLGGKDADNRFNSSTNTGVNYGMCRVIKIESNALTVDKTGGTFTADTGTGKSIDIYFGKFVSNVSIDNPKFSEKSYQFEASYPNLGDGGVPEYEYAKGNYANQLTAEFPLTDKSTMTIGFIGTDTDVPTPTRAAGTHVSPKRRAAVNTSTNFARMRLAGGDDDGLTTYIKSATMTINNNVSPEKVLGQIGAAFMNIGDLEITMSTQVLFTSKKVLSSIRNNETLTMDIAIQNDDGAVVWDIPSLTLGNGSKELTANETIKINVDGTSFGDDVLNTSMGVTLFAYVPGNF